MRRWRIDQRLDGAERDAVAGILRGDGVVLLPTDTIYGLHGMAGSDDAVARIAAMKGRDDTKPFLVLASSMADAETLGAILQPNIREVLEELWPGPLTAIVPLRAPVAASRGAASIGIRIPAIDWLRALVERTGPLASTSANRSGEPAIEAPDQLAADLQSSLDAIVDAGPLRGEPSVVVDFTGTPRIVREGEIFFTQKVWKRLRKSS